MKSLLLAVAAMAMAVGPARAHQDAAKVPFYDFEGRVVDAAPEPPAARRSPHDYHFCVAWSRPTKKSFMPALIQTSKARVFK